jgi:membrane protease YdiL (CAAX protease family)
MKKAFKNIGKVIWAPAIFLGAQFSVSFAYMLFLSVASAFRIIFENMASGADIIDPDEIAPEVIEEMIWSMYNAHVPVILSAGLTFLFVYLVMQKEWKAGSFWSFEKITANSNNSNLMIIGMCAGLGVALNLFMVGALTLVPIPQPEQPFDFLLGDNLFILLLSLGLIAPFLEEIIYRGIVQKQLMKFRSLGVRGAIILQAVIFGAVHLNFYQGVYTFFLAIIIGVLYFWYDSIWVPVTVHITFNATSLMLSHIAGETEINGMIFMMITFAALMISGGFMAGLSSGKPKPRAAGIFDRINSDISDISDVSKNDDSNNNEDDTPPFVG